MNIAELRALPNADKLRIVETLWEDLVASGAEIRSPAWHEAELKKAEADFKAGRVEVLDLATIRKELQQRRK